MLDADDEAADAKGDLDKLLRQRKRRRIPVSASDVQVASDRHSAAQLVLATAKAEARRVHDVLWSFDSTAYPEARYCLQCVTSCQDSPPQGLDLLQASGLLVDRSLDVDYEVR